MQIIINHIIITGIVFVKQYEQFVNALKSRGFARNKGFWERLFYKSKQRIKTRKSAMPHGQGASQILGFKSCHSLLLLGF